MAEKDVMTMCSIKERIMSLRPLSIVKFPNQVLKSQAKKVEVFDSDLKILGLRMLKTMAANNGIGLAAPQVNILKRIIAIDTKNADVKFWKGIMVNPEIIEKSGEFTYLEGCLSMPGEAYWTTRSDKITVQWQTVDGNLHQQEFSGLTSICIQHEIDHLNGITMNEIGTKDDGI